jgi:hypothetical protein
MRSLTAIKFLEPAIALLDQSIQLRRRLKNLERSAHFENSMYTNCSFIEVSSMVDSLTLRIKD